MNAPAENISLREILDLEQQCCVKLLEISGRERAAVSGFDLPGVAAAKLEREEICATWYRLVMLRRSAVGLLGGSIDALAAADPSLADALAQTRDLADRLREAQAVNEGMIGGVLGHVQDLLSVLRRNLPQSRYDRRALLTTASPAHGGLQWSA